MYSVASAIKIELLKLSYHHFLLLRHLVEKQPLLLEGVNFQVFDVRVVDDFLESISAFPFLSRQRLCYPLIRHPFKLLTWKTRYDSQGVLFDCFSINIDVYHWLCDVPIVSSIEELKKELHQFYYTGKAKKDAVI